VSLRWTSDASDVSSDDAYGVATVSRLLKTIGLFCRIWSLLKGSFAKETYNVKPHMLTLVIDEIYIIRT